MLSSLHEHAQNSDHNVKNETESSLASIAIAVRVGRPELTATTVVRTTEQSGKEILINFLLQKNKEAATEPWLLTVFSGCKTVTRAQLKYSIQSPSIEKKKSNFFLSLRTKKMRDWGESRQEKEIIGNESCECIGEVGHFQCKKNRALS